ncbi:UNVERIFIED_ORG: hypothetical protein M2438_004777 [Methylobacterium sp. SuP10 SLI 274]|nr:hypothetical protein [Methylorubrum extorquens]MDF9794346.1 hypothetical protein [Methylorubrum extorquens]MDF9866050.1 hypothetical protein [Methylorubrum pseudosasae]MDH6639602.1 hypothetical protein [Methylobacterium sp. SuP10 SLI 274]MDH6668795.1 hypothetical protein [Methylorubrum zatmanii]
MALPAAASNEPGESRLLEGGVISCGSIGYVSGIADWLKPEGRDFLRALRA